MRVYLFQPQIPQNTGNIARTCAALGCSLRLVPPLGFDLDESRLKRAGLDYWRHVDWKVATRSELQDLVEWGEGVWLFSSNAKTAYHRVQFQAEDALVFGNETQGLPPEWLKARSDRAVAMPQKRGIRCLNLSTAVGIGLYEAHRQLNFAPLSN